MSFRELRTFTETMRMLGYNRIISVENFRTPNIELVADVLFWLVKRYEPSADISFQVSTEGDRIIFFRRVCELVLAKSRIKLNIKKLYQADGYAVQELLKLAQVLKEASTLREAEDSDYSALQAQAQQRGHQEAKKVRQLCSDLTNGGSALFFLVEQEIKNVNQREMVLSRATEVGEFERRLRELLSKVSTEVESLTQSLQNLQADESGLEQKIESKKTQLERSQKRLKSLMNVRPAFMEEYEKYETELHQLFVVYLEQYRNLEYLEHQLAKFNKIEDELLAEQETKLRVMRERLRKEELKVLRGDAFGDAENVDMEGMEPKEMGAMVAAQKAASMNMNRIDNSRGESKRPRVASGRQRPTPSSTAAELQGEVAGVNRPSQGNLYDPGDDSESEDTEDETDDDSSLSINNDSDSGSSGSDGEPGEDTDDSDVSESESDSN